MLFGEKILDYWDDILKDLATVVALSLIHIFSERILKETGESKP